MAITGGNRMTIEEIIIKYLQDNGFDGLCNPAVECGCGIDDCMPCGGEGVIDCQPAYKHICGDKRKIDCVPDCEQDCDGECFHPARQESQKDNRTKPCC